MVNFVTILPCSEFCRLLNPPHCSAEKGKSGNEINALKEPTVGDLRRAFRGWGGLSYKAEGDLLVEAFGLVLFLIIVLLLWDFLL